ncbi:MAG: ATP-binding cassette domain-containing protein [Phytoplasma sp.]|uniref:ABC transporter ATP-binding protein/permease n=1 Tax=Phytoplasma sp. TaxID=2155 RepID=UPI002B4129BB|nr:ATP-binding cassette domain-containing protein [Phytoplasma sp.]WRH06687.1 MAG: ATP-binding cassette domain-containing protein [Phytoplasma sp.]
MLNLVNVSKNYISKKKFIFKVLKNISLDLPDKGLIFLLGKSGSGKTTLLNLLGCIDNLDEGDILIHNNSILNFKNVDYDNYRNGNVGFVFQDYNLISDLTVAQNIALSLQLQGKKATPILISEALKNVDLEGHENRFINELSGGQKQKVAIARAFIKNTSIILCDEPTGNLDSETAKNILNFLKKMSDNKLILIVTHDTENAFIYGDRIIELKDGQILSDLSKNNKLKNTKSQNKLDSLKGQTITEELLKQITENNQNNYKKIFIPTPKQPKTTEIKPLTKIFSHLPSSLTFKMGISFFKTKKVYFFLTILFSTLLYNMFDFCFESYLWIFCIFKELMKNISLIEQKLVDTTLVKNSEISLFIMLIFILSVSFFLIGGFIKNTIKFKKKDIGILRALGARKIDIFKIFFTEGFMISYIISVCLGIIFMLPFQWIHWAYFFKNISIKNIDVLRIATSFNINVPPTENNIEQAIKNFNFWSQIWILIPLFFVINLIVTFLSIFFPINKFAKKKVIEVILDK